MVSTMTEKLQQRGISTNDAHQHGEHESTDGLSSPNEDHQHDDQSGHRSIERAAQRLVQGLVTMGTRSFLLLCLHVFTDPSKTTTVSFGSNRSRKDGGDEGLMISMLKGRMP